MKLIVSFVLLTMALASTSIAVPAPTTKDLNLTLRDPKARMTSDAALTCPYANEQDEDQQGSDGDELDPDIRIGGGLAVSLTLFDNCTLDAAYD